MIGTRYLLQKFKVCIICSNSSIYYLKKICVFLQNLVINYNGILLEKIYLNITNGQICTYKLYMIKYVKYAAIHYDYKLILL